MWKWPVRQQYGSQSSRSPSRSPSRITTSWVVSNFLHGTGLLVTFYIILVSREHFERCTGKHCGDGAVSAAVPTGLDNRIYDYGIPQ